jgi:signal transduction histidine kinase
VRLTPEREIEVYRIVQEALSNVARHAQAQAVSVTASFTERELVVQVQDDGRGFSVPDQASELAVAGHYGLLGMRERADMIEARLDIHSEPGSGTTLELRLQL